MTALGAKAKTPNIQLDLTQAGFKSKVTLDELMVPGVRAIQLTAECNSITTLSFDAFVTNETVVRAKVGKVEFRIVGIDLPEETRREIFELLKAEFEPPEVTEAPAQLGGARERCNI
jgi:hypothetical protein